MNRRLRLLRIGIAIFVFALISMIFLDIYHLVPEKTIKSILGTQFVPSLISALKIGGIAIGAFVLISISALLAGRAYCSVLCPLGILMDVILRIKKAIKKRSKYRYIKPLRYIPLSILIITIILLLLGNIQLVSLLDPYSNFGRINTVLFKPVVIFLNNSLYDLFVKFDNYTLLPISFNPANLTVTIFVLAFFTGIVYLTLKRGRLFCTHICPVGAFLGLISRFSFIKIKINSESCISCGLCEINCKSNCINLQTKEIDASRCVMCLNCVDVKCPKSGIELVLAKFKKKSSGFNPERRDTIKALSLAPVTLFTANKILVNENGEATDIKKRQTPITPPGSLSISQFTDKCTACYLCVNTCPSNAIRPSLFEYGLKGIMLPHLTNEKGYCNFECTKCTEICPNEAILPVSKEEKKTLQIGIAKFVRELCVVITDKTDCGACSEHCPTKAVNMVVESGLRVPIIDESICVGCGACEYACPVTPHKAIFIEGNKHHLIAEKPKFKKLQKVNTDDDFPF